MQCTRIGSSRLVRKQRAAKETKFKALELHWYNAVSVWTVAIAHINNSKRHLKHIRNAQVLTACWLIMSKGTDDGDSELHHTGAEDKMGAIAHTKSLEVSNKIDFIAEDI